MIEITSINNEVVKETVKLRQKKYRQESNKFLLEGFKPIEEALLSGIKIEKIFVDKNCTKKIEGDLETIITNDAVLKKISTTDSAPEIVAVGIQKKWEFADIKDAKKVLLLENIRDYGNLGTILRTAKAFSQDAIILYGDTVDLYNPKCVRSAVGNLWKIPVLQIKDLEKLKKLFCDFERIATLPLSNDTIEIQNYKPKSPYLVMFGSEADGLSPQLKEFATKNITIKMDKTVESLNLSISVGVVLYSFTL